MERRRHRFRLMSVFCLPDLIGTLRPQLTLFSFPPPVYDRPACSLVIFSRLVVSLVDHNRVGLLPICPSGSNSFAEGQCRVPPARGGAGGLGYLSRLILHVL